MDGARLHRNKVLISLVGLGVGVLGFCVWGGWVLFGMGTSLNAARTHIVRAEASARAFDVVAARRELSRAQTRIEEAQRIAALGAVLSSIPLAGDQYTGLRAVVDASWYSVRAVDILASAVEALRADIVSLPDSISHIDFSTKGKILSALARSEPALHAARTQSALASAALEKTRTLALIAPLAAVIDEVAQKNLLIQKGIESSMPYVANGPFLLGYPSPRTYLFLLQNNTEVRGTGGFIGNYGILKVHNGAISSFFTDNIYNLDDPAAAYLAVPPPAPLSRYFPSIKRWFLRDSNWSPDFPTAARQAAWFYTHEGGRERIDGVIAVTPDVLISFLKILGPVEVDGILFTPENFLDQLQYHVEKGYVARGIAEPQRKEIVGRLARILVERLERSDVAQWKDILALLSTRAEEKHILISLVDPVLQAFASSQGWTGSIHQASGDFLMVVDSNMGSMKTDMVMDKHISYTLREEQDGSLYAKVMLTYRNNGRFSWNTTRYRDYIRVYVPDGSQVIRSSGALRRELSTEPGSLEISREHGKMSIGAFLVVEPKETKTLTIEYRLPVRISQQVSTTGKYTLFVQKQAGVSGQTFSADLKFQNSITGYLPQSPTHARTGEKEMRLAADLRVDREFTVNVLK